MIHKARIAHIPVIQKILGEFAGQGKLLARPLSELYTNLRDLVVAIDDESGEVVGCCSGLDTGAKSGDAQGLQQLGCHQGSTLLLGLRTSLHP